MIYDKVLLLCVIVYFSTAHDYTVEQLQDFYQPSETLWKTGIKLLPSTTVGPLKTIEKKIEKVFDDFVENPVENIVKAGEEEVKHWIDEFLAFFEKTGLFMIFLVILLGMLCMCLGICKCICQQNKIVRAVRDSAA